MLQKSFIISFVFLLFFNTATSQERKWDKECEFLVIAEVLKIGEKPHGLSGRVAVVWMATYSVNSVLKRSIH